MSDAYENPQDLVNKKLSQLSLDNFPGDVKSMKLSNFINVAYTLSERWDVDTCDSGATTTKQRYNCCKVGAKSMGVIHVFPSVKEAKKIKQGKNLKKVVRFFLTVLEKLEEKYSDFYQRRSWPKASAKAKAPVSAPAPVVAPLELPECAFGPDAIPGQSNGGLMNSNEPSPVNSNPPAPEATQTPVESATDAMEDMKISDDQSLMPKSTSNIISWQNVHAGVEKFPLVLGKLKQLVARHVFQNHAEIVPDSFNFKVSVEVDVNIVNDRLARLMKKVLGQMHDDLDTGLQLSLHKTAASSQLTICN